MAYTMAFMMIITKLKQLTGKYLTKDMKQGLYREVYKI